MLCLRSVLELFIVFNFEDVGVEAGDPVLSVVGDVQIFHSFFDVRAYDVPEEPSVTCLLYTSPSPRD